MSKTSIEGVNNDATEAIVLPTTSDQSGAQLRLADVLRQISNDVEITRDARLQASIRLSRRQKWSLYAICYLSLFVIALSLIPNTVSLSHIQSVVLFDCSIVLSVFIIFTSCIDASQNFYHRGELLHQCARRISEIYHNIRLLDPGDVQLGLLLRQLHKDYRDILAGCPFNHDTVDYYRIRKTKPSLFKSYYVGPTSVDKLRRAWTGVRVVFLEWCWLMPHVIASALIILVVYKIVVFNAFAQSISMP